MHHSEGVFPGWKGLPLYYQCWYPDNPPRAVIALVHGLGSHSGLFHNIVQCLLPQDYVVCGFDLRGHGRSPGKRGYINAWKEFRRDVDCFLSYIAQLEQGIPEHLPRILIGHSLGGVISLDYALRHADALAGVVAIAPALGSVGVPPLKLTIGKALSKVWPRFTLNTGLCNGAASRDPEVINYYQNDPLRHTKGTARLATEFLNTAHWVHENARSLRCPLLILHGSEDQVALPEGSDRFFQKVRFPDKTRYEYDGGYHDLHNDTNFPEVLQDLSSWLEGQLSKAISDYACPLSA